MRKPPQRIRYVAIAAFFWMILIVCAMLPGAVTRSNSAQRQEDGKQERSDSHEPIQAIEPLRGLSREKIELGRRLFNDAKLSHDNRISCANCHNLRTGGADGRVRSIGINGAVGPINAPTVFNSGFNLSQFWDGRADTLENQVNGPLQAAAEMGSTWAEVIKKLESSPEYRDLFQRIYHDRIQASYIRNSIAEFERSLSTPNSRFDRYLRGANVLTNEEKEGYGLFKSFGCTSCHQGVNVGGNMYQKMGIMAPYFQDRGHITPSDRGRFNVTGDPKDLYMFKVPSLRNVDLTAPYFHDGSAATLTDAIRTMAKYQVGRPLSPQEMELIAAFLRTLTGELDGRPL